MSVYKMIRVVGSSETSWEDAAVNAVNEVTKHVRDVRIAEVEQCDMHYEGDKPVFRTRLHVSFRYEGS